MSQNTKDLIQTNLPDGQSTDIKGIIASNLPDNDEQLITAQKLRDTLDAMVDDYETIESAASGQIADINTKLADIKTVVDVNSNAVAGITNELTDVNQHITEVSNTAGEALTIANEALYKASDAQAQAGEALTIATAANGKIDSQLPNIMQQIDQTQGQVAQLNGRVSTLETEYNSLDSIIQSTISDVEEQGTKIQNLQTKDSELDALIQAVRIKNYIGPNDEIWYRTPNNKPIEYSDTNLASNTFNADYGFNVMKFKTNVTSIKAHFLDNAPVSFDLLWIPSTVTSIGNYFLSESVCTFISKGLFSNVTSVGSYFCYGTILKNTLDMSKCKNLTTMGGSSFRKITGNIIFPSDGSVTGITTSFGSSSTMTDVINLNFLKNITTIGTGTFLNSNTLNYIDITPLQNVETMAGSIFGTCPNLKYVVYLGEYNNVLMNNLGSPRNYTVYVRDELLNTFQEQAPVNKYAAISTLDYVPVGPSDYCDCTHIAASTASTLDLKPEAKLMDVMETNPTNV